MKNKIYFKIIGLIFTVTLFLVSCKKDDPVKLSPEIATWEIQNITSESANVSGFIIAEGNGFSEQGVCWNTTTEPTVNDTKAMVDNVDGLIFNATLTGLNYTTKYYVRAYAISNDGSVIYGADTSFTTLIRLPIVSIAEVTNIAGKTATSGGNVTDLGGGTVSARGLCWSKTPTPTIENDSTIDGAGAGEFITNITGLVGATPYYVRAYATNEAGTAYSSELTFTTPTSSPVITTTEVKDVKIFSATGVGYAWFAGGAAITELGFCWSTTENPTTVDNSVTSTAMSGQFEAELTGLTANTTYYVRAYGINSIGTAYGENIQFTTEPDPPTNMYLVGGSTVAGWTPANSVPFKSTATGKFEIFANITAAGGGFKFLEVQDWAGDWGKDPANEGSLLQDGEDNVNVLTDGQYRVELDLIDFTYIVTKTDWAVTGSATPNGWPDPALDHDMTYDAPTNTWSITLDLTAGDLKFRANNGWDINFGDTGANGSLEYGGDNIVIGTAGNYTITMTLGYGGAYTYSLTLN